MVSTPSATICKSNARAKPTFMKMVASGLPNNAPRWPEVAEVVTRILRVYKEDARSWERLSDWIERIGWERFFKLTGISFTYQHIDDFTFARETFRMTPTFKWE